MAAYYNEIEPFAAQWLRNLIQAGLIADGEVDERSIVDVSGSDLRGFTQCHFFAGIGVWSYALRKSGWSDDREVWTGSCPCQPFSSAGRGGAFDDERHLWPHFFRLIQEQRPDVVFGEQVSSKDGLAWLDFVCADLEAEDYAVGALDTCAAGVGAPHIRQRLYWVADSKHDGRNRPERVTSKQDKHEQEKRIPDGDCCSCELADSNEGRRGARRTGICGVGGEEKERVEFGQQSEGLCDVGELGNSDEERPQGYRRLAEQHDQDGRERTQRYGAAPGFWGDATWLPCRDGKARPVEPIAQQMADGSAESLGRLRPEAVKEIEKEITDAIGEADAREAVRNLRNTLSEEAPRRWPLGRRDGVSQAPILLSFLRQLSDQGWAFSEGISRPGTQASSGKLPSLRNRQETARSPHQRGLAGQPTGERADAVHFLSSILARHAQEAWGETFRRHAEDSFPIAHGIAGRVGRLRAYGNAIVGPQAQAFIESYMECRP